MSCQEKEKAEAWYQLEEERGSQKEMLHSPQDKWEPRQWWWAQLDLSQAYLVPPIETQTSCQNPAWILQDGGGEVGNPETCLLLFPK